MEKKRDLLSLISTNPSTSFAFRSGRDACAEEYDKKLLNLKIERDTAIAALKEAAEYHNVDDVNGEAGYIAWKTLKELGYEK